MLEFLKELEELMRKHHAIIDTRSDDGKITVAIYSGLPGESKPLEEIKTWYFPISREEVLLQLCAK